MIPTGPNVVVTAGRVAGRGRTGAPFLAGFLRSWVIRNGLPTILAGFAQGDADVAAAAVVRAAKTRGPPGKRVEKRAGGRAGKLHVAPFLPHARALAFGGYFGRQADLARFRPHGIAKPGDGAGGGT
ncbi:hypothetical protein ACFOMH_02185 [Paracoccus mangrovi]|uniref:Uncharacterized protein n=1 Tax=Paracoccus mangrovi TaxID=1715645 RepID=A0ABV7R114_9RHOB